MSEIKNIIFDLGNVILNIDTNLSKIAFEKEGLKDFNKLYSLASQSDIFDKLEIGAISEEEFYDNLRNISKTNLSNQIIKTCWNALIKDYPPIRIELLKTLKFKYRLFLLSNTNIIHYNHYTEILKKEYNIDKLENLFEKAYFSHEIGLKKPDSAIYEFVTKDSNLNKIETVFIDDNKQNIESAKNLGIKTIWINSINIEDLDFDNL